MEQLVAQSPPERSAFNPTLSRRTALKAGAVVLGSGAIAGNTDMSDLTVDCDPTPGDPIQAHVTYESEPVPGQVDLIRSAKWPVAGIAVTDAGLYVEPTGLAIRNKRNNNVYDPNPPFNFRSMLRVGGDFEISTRVESPTPLQWQFYSDVPIRLDDLNYYPPSVTVTTKDNLLQVGVLDGSSQTPTPHEFPFTGAPTDMTLTMQRQGTDLAFTVNGKQVGVVPKGDIFGTNELWFGVNANDKAGLVSEFTAKPLNGATMALADRMAVTVTEPSPPGLETLVPSHKKDFHFGTAVSLNQLVADPQYQQQILGGGGKARVQADERLLGDFGMITTENDKPQDTEPREGYFTLNRLGALLTFAEQTGQRARLHALLYAPTASPEWMINQSVATAADRLRVQNNMINHIQRVGGFAAGRAHIVDVANETIAGTVIGLDPPHVDENIFYQAFGGEQYLYRAFEETRDVMPGTKRFLNEYGIGNWYDMFGRGDAFYKLVRRMVDAGVPIDGVGLQCHVASSITVPGTSIKLPDHIIYDHLCFRMQQFEDLGLDAQVTELDVGLRDGTPQDICRQAKQFAVVVKAALDAPNCTGVTFWDSTDKYGSGSWINDQGQYVPANSTLYTADFRPKAAVALMRRILQAAA